MQPKENKRKSINVTIDPLVLQQLDAARGRMPRSQWMEEAVCMRLRKEVQEVLGDVAESILMAQNRQEKEQDRRTG